MPIVAAILGIILVVMAVVFFTTSPADEPTVPVATEQASRPEVTEPAVVTETAPTGTDDPVADLLAKTLSSNATYLTPSRSTGEIDVTLTIEAGVVTDAKVVYEKGTGYSSPHQERFENAYKPLVIGKKLDEISLSRVGGASLTSQAFNEAVAAIKVQS